MPVSAEDEARIQAAVQRGALSPERVGYWRGLAEAGEDTTWLDVMTATHGPQPVRAAAGQRYVDVVTASVPPGTDPALHSADPLYDEMRATKPGLIAAAERDDPHHPRLFFEFDSDLPEFCASGLSPDVLRRLPWPARRPVAEAATMAAAYELVARYGGPDPDMPALLALRYSRHNAPYIQAFSAWLMGPSRNSVEQQVFEAQQQPRHPQTGQYVSASAWPDPAGAARAAADADAADLTGQALHDEIFGPGQ